MAEHIPPVFENVFVSNLVEHARYGIVLSWSQWASHWHRNARPNAYVRELFLKHGFRYMERESDFIRRAGMSSGMFDCCKMEGGVLKGGMEWAQRTFMAFERMGPMKNFDQDLQRQNAYWLSGIQASFHPANMSESASAYVCQLKACGRNFVKYLRDVRKISLRNWCGVAPESEIGKGGADGARIDFSAINIGQWNPFSFRRLPTDFGQLVQCGRGVGEV